MKLLKIMLAGMVVMSLALAQDDTQGGQPTGPPPCDEWLNSDMAHDMNGDGTVDENDCPQQGPDPFQQAFMTTMQNGGTPDEAFEAVAAVFHQMEVECDDCDMTEEEFQEEKAEAKAAFDAVLANGGTPEEAFHAAMEAGDEGGDQGPPTCDVCGYTFAGEGDHHGHCDKCDFVFTSDNDQHGHCDQCDYIFSGEGDQHGHCDKCDHIWSGDPEDHHGHCDHEGCDFVGNTNEDWENHHHDDGGAGDGGPDPVWEAFAGALEGGASPEDAFEAAAAVVHDMEVGCDDCDMTEEEFAEGKANAKAAFDAALADGKSPEEAFGAARSANDPPVPTNHWNGNCAALCGGHGEYWLDSDGDGQPEDGPYATWDHDADGNPVDCGCGGDEGEGEGDEGDGDTHWADEAYQLQGSQDHYDRVMGVSEEDRENEYNMIRDELGMDDESEGEGEGEGGDHNDQGGGSQTCQFVDNDGNQCGYVFTGTEADQDHHHN